MSRRARLSKKNCRFDVGIDQALSLVPLKLITLQTWYYLGHSWLKTVYHIMCICFVHAHFLCTWYFRLLLNTQEGETGATAKDLLLRTSRAISRVLYLYSVFFALSLEEFLGNFVLSFVSNSMQWRHDGVEECVHERDLARVVKSRMLRTVWL